MTVKTISKRAAKPRQIEASEVVQRVVESRMRLDIGRDPKGQIILDVALIQSHPWWVITGYEDRLALGERLQPSTAGGFMEVERQVRHYERFQKLKVLYGYPCETVDHSIQVVAVVDGLQLIEAGASQLQVLKPELYARPIAPTMRFNVSTRPLAKFAAR